MEPLVVCHEASAFCGVTKQRAGYDIRQAGSQKSGEVMGIHIVRHLL
jgi:hypothetical protein